MRRRDWLKAAAAVGGALLLGVVTSSELCIAGASVQRDKIDAIFTAAGVKSNRAPGAAVLVVKDGRSVFERGYGVRDLHSPHAIDARTNFRLASLTKQFTAMAVMLLIKHGKLHYHDRLTDLFPDFAEYGKSISVRNLLNHTSGLEDYEDLLTAQYPNTPAEKIPQITDAGVTELLKKCNGTKFVPGSKWQYSNSGYVVLAIIVERVSGQPFGAFLHDRIFVPLNMQNTIAYEKGKNKVENRAYGYSQKEKGAGWTETDQSPTSATLGDGGVYSSMDDLAKWDRAIGRHTLLSEREMEPALTPVRVSEGAVTGPDGTPADYGFGWFLDSYNGHVRMWHYGETIGFRNTIQRFVNDRLTIVVLCNRADLNPTALALQVADLFLDVEKRK